MMGDHLAISTGLLQAPLDPLKTDVSRGPPGLPGGPGPFGPHRNSTTGPSHKLGMPLPGPPGPSVEPRLHIMALKNVIHYVRG